MAGRGVDIILGGNPPDESDQKKVLEAGGLHVIGTERHESRRIDNQLRGRAGRQGDPGSSQFYVSTEDDLMRIFGGDRMKSLMKTLNVPEDMPIQNSMLSKSIESAQRKVEGNNFDMRKQLVEYDDVINKHREAIYRRRKEIMEIAEKKELNEEDRTLSDIVLDMVSDEISYVVNFHTQGEDISSWDLQEVSEVTKTVCSALDVKDEIVKMKAREDISKYIMETAGKKYEEMKSNFTKAGIDFKEVEKSVLIRSIDTLWVEHLETIDALRQGIGLRGYGQHDPLVEYKKEAYLMFQELNGLIQKQVAYSIFKTGEALGGLSAEKIQEISNINENKKLRYQAPEKTMVENHSHQNVDLVHEKVKNEAGEKVGRNDLCPCGSGKKYKKCCGK
jgi:preprotein translocase subunit SecA